MSKFFLGKLFSKTPKTTGTGAINTTNISKNLKEFQKHKEDIIKSTDKYGKGLTDEGKIQIKKAVAPALSKLSKITQKKPQFNKGGRVGLKAGTNPFMKKSNIKKIQETFGPKKDKKRVNAKGGKLIGGQKNIDVAAPFGTLNKKDFAKLAKLRDKKTKKKVI